MKMRVARGRSAGPNIRFTRIRQLVNSAPPPTPCTKRAATIWVKPVLVAAPSVPAMNSSNDPVR
ncbi:hypothetical protein D3C87_1098580 [compost metagenome]